MLNNRLARRKNLLHSPVFSCLCCYYEFSIIIIFYCVGPLPFLCCEVINCPCYNLSYPYIKKLSQHCKIEHHKDCCYLCTYCGRSYKYISKLLRHLGVHTREKPFACHICSSKCSSKTYSLNIFEFIQTRGHTNVLS